MILATKIEERGLQASYRGITDDLQLHQVGGFLNVCFVPKAESRVYSSPIAFNKSAGTFVGILKIEKT